MTAIFWQPGITLEKMEELVIARALVHYKGDRLATAESLGISRKTIDNKIDKYKEDQEKAEFFLEQKRKRDEINLLRARGKYVEPDAIFEMMVVDDSDKFSELEKQSYEHEQKAESREFQVTTLRGKKTSK